MSTRAPQELWEPLKNEPPRAYRALESYLLLPSADRTLLAAYRSHVGNPHARKPSDTWSQWSSRFAWRERAAYDEHLACGAVPMRGRSRKRSRGKVLWPSATE